MRAGEARPQGSGHAAVRRPAAGRLAGVRGTAVTCANPPFWIGRRGTPVSLPTCSPRQRRRDAAELLTCLRAAGGPQPAPWPPLPPLALRAAAGIGPGVPADRPAAPGPVPQPRSAPRWHCPALRRGPASGAAPALRRAGP